MKKRVVFSVTVAAIMLFGTVSHMFTPVAKAAGKSPVKEYEFYPTPHSVEYGNGMLSLNKGVQVIYDDTIDRVTKRKVEKAFTDHGLEAPSVASEPSKDKVNLMIGTKNSNGPVDNYASEHVDSEGIDFDQIDAYQLDVSDNNIVILGKDTDASFYGVVTLEAILAQSPQQVIRNMHVNDFANTEIRGFIEGYYGIPWSNEDRMSLMRFGGNHKMNSYVFAPKDDPYHREKWDELYPKEELEEIGEMADVGEETKTRFIWTISPLGEVAELAREEGQDAAMDVLDENTDKLLAKFDQLYDVGVRQFGVNGDDVGNLPTDYVVELMHSISEWADEKGDVRDTLYTPASYNSGWAWNPDELNAYEKGFDDNIHILWTGSTTCAPVVQSTIDVFKNKSNDGVERRDPLFWLNWPVNDVDMQRVFLGKGEMLEPGIENLAGVVTNPMQEAEASKIAIFAIADYTWNTEDFDAQTSWEDSFKYIEPDAAEALHELAKHMSDADPNGLKLSESEDIKELLDSLTEKLDNGESLKGISPEAMDAFQTIADAADGFMAKTKNENLKEELEPFVNALHDMVLADKEFLKAAVAVEDGNNQAAWNVIEKATALRQQSLNYDRPLIDGTTKAKPAQKRLQPFTDHLQEKVTIQGMQTLVDYEADQGNMDASDARLLQTHLKSLDHFINVKSYEKAEKHMKSLKQLVAKYQEAGQIDEDVAKTLVKHADILIEKWQ
ncbi:beta-N-acetylglucosaminidase domain-containing protein [Lentibacillus sp. L22]|uniref:beta-N-acetylglucosaminidase domain-containing protein n=1 Tax=Lentibacillus sp. L22 TaxID=3163028 RepID=UPI00346729EE